MENKDVESTRNRPEGDRIIDAQQLLIDIGSFAKQLKSEKQWKKSDRNSITIFKSDKMRIVLTALRKKAEMYTQYPDNILSLHIIDGRIVLETLSKKIKIRSGQILALHEKIPYTIRAKEKTLVLLTIVE